MRAVRRDGRKPCAHPRLFAPEELRLQRTGPGRGALARRPGRLPEEDRATMELLKLQAADLAECFGLRYAAIERERSGVNSHYGICYEDGRIRIRLRHATTGRILKESSLVATLCHELAHLRHFDHSPRFQRFYLRILAEARRRGYYRPGPEEREGIQQRSLFEEWSCGTGTTEAAGCRER